MTRFNRHLFKVLAVCLFLVVLGSGVPRGAKADLFPAPTGVTGVAGAAKIDLSWTAPTNLAFPVSFNGTTYNNVFIGSNSYVTFGAGSDSFSVSATTPSVPTVHLCSGDMSFQQVYYKIDNTVTPNQLRVRFEGTNKTSGAVGNPNIIYELVFYRDQSYFDAMLGTAQNCTVGSERFTPATPSTKMISSGSASLSTPAFAANTSWRITGGTATQNGNTASMAYSSSSTVSASTMLTSGWIAAVNSHFDDSFVRMLPEISGYRVQMSTDGGATWDSARNVNSSATTYTVSGLANGITYMARVAALTSPSSIAGEFSISPSYTPRDKPATVSSGLVATPSNAQVVFSWNAPSANGSPITGYTLQSSTDGGTTWVTEVADTGNTNTSYTFTGLANGTTYRYRVAAINALGTGGFSSGTNGTPRTVPDAPTNVSAIGGNGSATVTWTPGFNGGAAITNHIVQYSTNGGTSWSQVTTSSTNSSFAVNNLPGDNNYIFRVGAFNTAGWGSFSSASSSIYIQAAPGAPTSVVGTSGIRQVALSWTAPSANGGSAITGYRVEYSVSGGSWITAIADTGNTNTTYTVTGLTAGSGHAFRVSAINAIGTGTASSSSPTYTPYDTPSAPPTPTVTAGSFQATFSGTNATSNGSAITNYWLQSSTDGGATWNTAALTGVTSVSSIVATGLTANTSYVFRIAAVNVAGIGPWSAQSNSVTIFGTPSAPTGLSATAGILQATLSWTAPSSDNGRTITRYSIQSSTNGGSTWGTAIQTTDTTTSWTVTSLTAGTSYVFRVAAVNSAGTGTYSSSSAAVTVYNVPATPGSPSLTAGRQQVTFSWVAPSANGATITNYWYQSSTDGGVTWTPATSTGSTSTSIVVNGLTGGTVYRFRVAAENIAGIGGYALASSVTVFDFAGAPTNVAGTPGNGQVAFTWTAAPSNGSAITGHMVQSSTDGGTTWSAGTSTGSSGTTYTLTGLTNGTSYMFRVAASNAAGTGTYSTPIGPLTPFTVPGVPTSLSRVAGDQQVTLSWVAPSSNGSPITNYSYQASLNGTTWASAVQMGVTSSPFTVTGLTNGTTYYFRIAATNAAGTGSYTSATTAVTPVAVPAQVGTVTPTAGNTQVSLSWSAPSTNGSAITDYLIQRSDDGGNSWTTFSDSVSTTASATVTGLTNGTAYVFRVAAVNAIGTGAYSATSVSATPFTFASAPAAPTATPGNAQVVLSWTAPASNGAAISNYMYQTSSNGGSTWGAAVSAGSNGTTVTVTGLTNGTSYVFRVAAVNAAGTGSYSGASSAAVPATVPSQVGTVTPTAGTEQVSLAWSSPSNGGSAITDYIVQWSSDGGSTWTTFADSISTATSATVTGLTNATSYVFRVAAVNAMGTGTYSGASTLSTPFTFASAPDSVTATAGVVQVSLSWNAPNVNGSAITSYTYQFSTNGGTTWSSGVNTGSTSTSATVTGLTANTTYVFRVAATNGAGLGSYSTASNSVVPYNVPAAPTSVTGMAGKLLGTVSWTAPSSNGSAITNYRYQISTDGGSTWTPASSTSSTATSLEVSNLNAGTSYVFRVAAENVAGVGAWSSATSSVVPYDVPAASQSVTGVAGGNQVTLSWTNGSSNFSAITDHRVQWSMDGGTTWSSAVATNSATASFTVTGLIAQQGYVFRIAAANAAGVGPWSQQSTPISPYGIPFAPGTPTGVSGNGQVSLTWTAADGNGSPITGYLVRWSTDAGVTWSSAVSTGSTSLSYTVTGLINGTSYVFEVAGVNAGGAGTYSADSAAVIPATTPSAVGTISTGPSDSQVDLTWTAPNNGGNAIVDYVVQYSSNSGTTWITFTDAVSSATSVTVTGLNNGTAYVFRIAAVNSVGTGAWSNSSSSATPRAVASAPLSLAALAGNTQVALSWQTPLSDGGMTITDYTVQWSSNGGTSWTTFVRTASSVPTATVTGLTNGTEYVFRVAAVNSVGTGPWATTSTSHTPFTVAGAPTSVLTVVGDEEVALSWTAPSNNGGSAVADYQVEYSSNSGNTWVTFVDGVSTATSATVSNLSNGTSYIFRVRAVNAAGNSTASVASASATPRTVPTFVQAVTTTPGDSHIALAWSAPASNGGASLTDYIVQWSDNSGSTWNTFNDGVSTTASATINGLTNGAPYVFRVAATNAAGTGAWSIVTTPAIPYTTPGAPLFVTPTPLNARVTLSWVSPANNGGNAITDYLVQYSSDNGSTWTAFVDGVSSTTSTTVTGLTNGTAYVFRVAASNDAGAGSWSTASNSSTPITTATAPVITSATPLSTQVALSWNAPSSNGGSAITDYQVSTSTDGGVTWGVGQSVGSGTSINITGLTNGSTYTFRVRAVNGAGAGAWSAMSDDATPRTLSDAPLSVTGTPGNAQISLVWSVPTFNGGAAITDYVVQYSDDAGTTWATFSDGVTASRAATVTGLTNGTDYIFRVAAVNVAGTGSWSTSSAIVTPRTVPAPPVISSIAIGNGILTVNFTAGDSGGTTITGYEYSTDNGATWRTRVIGSTQSPLIVTTLSSDGTSALANGVTYDIKLRAVNVAGVGSASLAWSATPLTIPTVATNVQPSPAASSAVLVWNVPSFDGGTAITDYLVEYTSDSGQTWTSFNDGVSPTNSATVTGLTNGTVYAFRVAAVNSQGTGNWSVMSSSVIPRTTPGIPTGITVTPGNQQLSVLWTAPSNGGAVITDYIVSWSSDSGSTWTTFNDGFSSATSATLTGLTNGTAYLVRIAAVNIAGTGSAGTSGSASTPRTVPSAPTLGLPTSGNNSISVPFTLGSNGGAAVSSVDYSLDDGSTWVTGASSSSPLVVTGLTNGSSYTIRIRAVNVAGAGAASSAATATPRTVPGAPLITTVTPINTGATVAFTQPSTGGAVVSDYQYSTDNGSTWTSAGVSSSPISITGLTNGSAYTIKIRAINIAGNGIASDGASVTPFTTPGSPTITQATGGIRTITVNISAGATGGSVITNYEWSVDNGATWVPRSPASTSSSFTITGLNDGTNYPVRVRAVNAAGSGASSDASIVRTHGVPSAPTINSVSATSSMLSLVITPGANGGDPITNYEYSLDNGATWITRSPASTNTNLSITGLINGYTYLLKVRAINGVGTSIGSLTVPGKPHTTPSAPVLSTQVDGGNQSLTVTFNPGLDGGESLVNYEFSTDRGATWRPRTDGTGTTSPMVITVLSTDGTTRLTNGVTYAVQLRAVNIIGAGSVSNDVSGTPLTTPDAPSISRVTPDDRAATISFTAGGNGGSIITGYQYSTDGGSSWASLATMASPARITSQSTIGAPALVNGTTYQVRLRAVNAVGNGSATASETLTPRTTPDSPSIGSATPGDRTITVAFTAGANGGATIISYEYSTDGGTTWRSRVPGASMVSTPITITTQSFDGLTRLVNGISYDVMIRAVNAAGSGRESQTVWAIPSGIPGMPTITSIAGEDGRIRVFFTQGQANGSAVTSTQYSIDGGTTWTTAASLSSPIVISGLTNGTTYAVQLRAVNANGSGLASLAAGGKPFTRSAAPVISAVASGNTTVSVTFTAPANGGDAITTYQFSTDNGVTWMDRTFGTIETTMGIPVLSTDGTTPLTNGTAYNIAVRAVNGAGPGAPSDSVRVTPYTVPATPVISAINPVDSGADVVYSLSTNGGNAVTSVDYSLNGGSSWTVTNSAANPLRISGLANGSSYSVVIRASNAAGAGNISNTRTVAPSGSPDMPVINNVVAGNGTLTYEFTPGFDSGATITGYQYSIDNGATWQTAVFGSQSNRFVISGLGNGVVYSTFIRAVNINGPGVPSAVTIVKPYTVPEQPTSASAIAADSSISLSYTPPVFDGGQPITGYEYSIDNGATWVRTASPNVLNLVIPNLTNTTSYTVAIRAVSAAGPGAHITVRARAIVTPPLAGTPTPLASASPTPESSVTTTAPAPPVSSVSTVDTKKKKKPTTTKPSSSGSGSTSGSANGSGAGNEDGGTTPSTVPSTTPTSNPTNQTGSGSAFGGGALAASLSVSLMLFLLLVLLRRRRRSTEA